MKTEVRKGQMVRISNIKGAFEKGYLPNWSEEHFLVESDRANPRRVYKLKDTGGEEMKGSWYPEEIQPIAKNKYLIEKVLQKRKAHKASSNSLSRVASKV